MIKQKNRQMIKQKNIIDKLIIIIYYKIVINQILQPVKIVSLVFLRLAFIFGISPIFSHEKIEKLAKTKRKMYNHGFRQGKESNELYKQNISGIKCTG